MLFILFFLGEPGGCDGFMATEDGRLHSRGPSLGVDPSLSLKDS